jgi:hypothetical protein
MVNMVLLSVDSEKHLMNSLEKIRLRGIQFVTFYEPDNQMGFTAACTQPLTAVYRREFRNFSLWTSSREVIKI